MQWHPARHFVRAIVFFLSASSGVAGKNDFSVVPMNPYTEGCLRHELDHQPNTLDPYAQRVCNSDDEDSTHCSSNSPLNYPEIVVHNSNWESSIFYAWIIQILLSERLSVPVTIQSAGTPRGRASFYHPDAELAYSQETYPYHALRTAHEVGDCSLTSEFCVHVLPEVWSGQKSVWNDAIDEGYLDSVVGNGMVGQLSLYVPRKLAEKDPTLVSHYGLRGEENRKKLANTFGRPVTWKIWCDDFSPTMCKTADERALRRPEGEIEEGSYFADRLFSGYFHFGEANNCTANENCTGHVVSPPCTWSSYIKSQMYWGDIKLESNGPEPFSNGYSYSAMIQIWRAANATSSGVMMWWWRPNELVEEFKGSPFEFQPVALVTPTEECIMNRITDLCSEDIITLRGKEEGSCDYEANAPSLLVAASLKTISHSVTSAMRSPGYDTIKALQISDLSFDSIFKQYIQQESVNGTIARKVVCQWVTQNIEHLEANFFPRGYPRALEYNSYDTIFLTAMGGLAVVVLVFILVSIAFTYHWKDTKVLKYAQVDFLLLILLGFVLITVGAFIYTLAPTDFVCLSRGWFVVLGYAFALIPLLVKVAAINSLLNRAQKMKQFKLTKQVLYRAVAFMIIICLIGLSVWTIIDPPKAAQEWILPDSEGNRVKITGHCASASKGWEYAVVGWRFLLLIIESVLAWQNRNAVVAFNESRVLAFSAYAHLTVATSRIVVMLFPSDSLSANNRAGVTSLLLSLDSLVSLAVYFVPKFRAAYFGLEPPPFSRSNTGSNSNTGLGANHFQARTTQLSSDKHDSRSTLGGVSSASGSFVNGSSTPERLRVIDELQRENEFLRSLLASSQNFTSNRDSSRDLSSNRASASETTVALEVCENIEEDGKEKVGEGGGGSSDDEWTENL